MSAALKDRAMYDPQFQAACQRYAHGGGSSAAIAGAVLAAIAAPEMLEALYQYVSDLRFPPTGDSIQRRIERAEAVIAKATGGAA